MTLVAITGTVESSPNRNRKYLKLFKMAANKTYKFSKVNIEHILTEAGKVTGVLALQQIANRRLHPIERYVLPFVPIYW